MFKVYDGSQKDPSYSGDIVELDLSKVEPCISGPKRPHDRVTLKAMKNEWNNCLSHKVGFNGFGLTKE